jgi:hypothetical protein
MSFAPQFANRWVRVIEPAIKRIEVDGTTLDPYRVDARRVSDSILTDVLIHSAKAI